MSKEGAEAEEDTESKQTPGSELLAQSWCGARIREPQDHDLSQSWTLNRVTQAPHLKNIFKFICLFWERVCTHVGAGGAGRERERENPKQA